jgi:hypothetical protein
MVKLFGWEGKMTGSLSEKREDELKLLWKTKLLETSAGFLGYVVSPISLDKSHELKINPMYRYIFPTITMMATYSFYTVVMKQELTGRNPLLISGIYFFLKRL